MYVIRGAKLNARECEVGKNGGHGVWVDGSTTTALLTDCTSHHNRGAGVFANSGGAVDLMGAGRPCTTTKETVCSRTLMAPSSTSANLAILTTCPMETRQKILTECLVALSNKKAVRDERYKDLLMGIKKNNLRYNKKNINLFIYLH